MVHEAPKPWETSTTTISSKNHLDTRLPPHFSGRILAPKKLPVSRWARLTTSDQRLDVPAPAPSISGVDRSCNGWRRAAPIQLATFTIPSHSQSSRRPANIPLHNLASVARPRDQDSAYLLDDHDKESARSSFDTPSDDSDLSIWTDTGDLVDQLADREDPLSRRLRDSLEDGHPSKPRRHQKRARFASQDLEKSSRGIRLEDIEIPDPGPRTISKAEKLLAAIMAPNDRPSRIHGLHGKKLIYFTSIFVSLGVFLFGYDQGVMSGIITGIYFKDYFNQPSAAELGTMVAILEVGAFISSLVVGRIGDVLGRRKTILYGSLIFVVGGALQTFATGIPMMLLGRVIAGLGVGTLSTIVPVYQSEISPPHNRGRMGCIEFTGNISGYAVSVWVDYFCTYIKNDWSWRVPLFMQCIMGLLLAAGSLLICESPRWLLDNDHDEEGIVVIANLYGKGDIHNPKARDEYREIKMNVLLQRQEGERSYSDMFKRYSKRVFIAMSAQALAQLNGINVISYYAPLVFEEAGWYGRQAILMTGINAITYLLSTIPPWYIVDSLGRRKILLSGALMMMVSLSAISYFIFLQASWTPNMVVMFVMIYNAAFGYSWGPIPWLYPPEILPLSIRAKGASLSTATNWAFNWLVGEMTPILQEHIQWRLYLIHAFFCAVSFVIVYFIYPETANVRLEDMNSLFGDATSVMPTPETLAQAESLFSGEGRGSPVPSLDIRGARRAQDEAIPGLNIDPPDIESGSKDMSKAGADNGEGIGGWISNMVKRTKSNGEGDSSGGKYKQVGQNED
ncbi:AraJ Arabinose efflux permease [Pyrenophora tritici-repentis]|nr:High affinity glucose transporter [Pyrenophora tritici-repentis]KAI0592430.1 High affinity glucose transporter [Pyrenophora tritici-repentis]KAI0615467.1 High affinity glucose transporter [Pyrenophora tritici-repentis]KAI0627523.1 High affinity glucose transporter [Pyrenophora tritici-repentis]KAI1558187.1 AraJ Arabinose efflux permease [Pyrenophora tritici-repentis]